MRISRATAVFLRSPVRDRLFYCHIQRLRLEFELACDGRDPRGRVVAGHALEAVGVLLRGREIESPLPSLATVDECGWIAEPANAKGGVFGNGRPNDGKCQDTRNRWTG